MDSESSIGSTCTLVGNPQNMIIGHRSGIGFADFFVALAPASVAGLGLLYLILRWGFRAELRAVAIRPVETESSIPADRRLLALTFGVLGLVTIGFLAGTNLAWTALAGGAVVMVFGRRDTHEVLKRVDWHLMVFFAVLLIVVHGFNETGLPDRLFESLKPWFGSGVAAQAWNLGHAEIGFWDHARYGIPVTLISTAVGVGALLWMR